MDDIKNITRDFGVVLCGTKNVTTLKFDNDSKTLKTYAIMPIKCRTPNSGLERLKMRSNATTLPPGKSVNFTFTYLSHVENIIDNVEYEILELDKVVGKLNIRAQTIGPVINLSVVHLKFFYSNDFCDNVKHIELQNMTKCEAKFWFDLNDKDSIIYISQTQGVIPSDARLSLKFVFKPKEHGIYCKQIYCLIQYHKPITFNIVGIYKPKINGNAKSLNFKFPFKQLSCDTYESYMARLKSFQIPQKKMTLFELCTGEYEDCPKSSAVETGENGEKIEKNISKFLNEYETFISDDVALSKRYLNILNYEEMPKATTLANLSKDHHYSFRWDNDVHNYFQIKPSKGVLKPETSMNFTIYFSPPIPDQFYSAEIDVRIFPCDKKEEKIHDNTVTLPWTISLTIIGNSFPNDSYGWLPQRTVLLKSLQLPSCTPGQIVYTTLLIERQGHLPLLFSTILPKDSKYAVQPSLGCIEGNFQLLVIRFNGAKEKGVYEETLKIIYNNSCVDCDCIHLKTFVEVPELIFGINNSYTFECTFPGSKTQEIIPFENPTNLCLSYKITASEDVCWIDLPNPSGIIEPMSPKKLTAIFKPLDAWEYLDYLQCSMFSVTDKNHEEIMNLQIIGSSQYGFLVAIPNMHDFGECLYRTEKSIKIHLFNFSPAIINYRLFAVHRAFPIGDIEKDLKIHPWRGKVLGKSSIETEITVVAHDKDIFQYAILCQILENDSKEALPCEESRKIFSMRFEGVLPSFEVIDLNIENAGSLFSPDWVWKMMSIDSLNKALNSLLPEHKIEWRFPEALNDSPPVTITLLLQSNKHGEASWNIEKKTLCPCNDSIVTSVCNSLCECVHSKSMHINPSIGSLPPSSRMNMHITLKYLNVGESYIQWIINLPYNRKIFLKSAIISLPDDEFSYASMYMSPIVKLRPIFIGDQDPPLQLFWLYNNTNKTTSYVLDKVTLRESTTKACRIFDCINSDGIIPPFSSVPLAFVFKPIEIITYVVEFFLCIHESALTVIRLEGEGCASTQQIKEFALEKTIPETPILENADVCLKVGVNCIYIPYFLVFSEVKRIFFLYNTSSTDSWAFHWHNFQVKTIITAKVKPNSGVIEPGKRIPLTLVLRSYCYSTHISFSVPCDVINYGKLKKYESATKFQKYLEEQSKDYFTITEKGISYDRPKIDLPEKPKSSHLFLTVQTNIINRTNIDQKLLLTQQTVLKSGEEVIGKYKISPTLPNNCLTEIKNILERTFWNILSSKNFEEHIKHLQGSLDYNYLQLASKSENKVAENFIVMSSDLNKNCIQEFFEDLFRKIIFKHVMAENKKKLV